MPPLLSRQTQAHAESRVFTTRRIPLLRPLAWLARGWADFMHCPGPGLLHGLAVFAFGLVLLTLAREQFWLLAGAFSGFLLVAPILATALYAVSRDLAQGLQPSLAGALRTWHPGHKRLVLFGSLLALAGTGWVLTSAALITRFAPAPVSSPQDFLQTVVLAREGWLFEAWLALGALMAAPLFASSVVAIPLLLERGIGVFGAVLTSWRAVIANPAPLALWAALLLALTLLAMAPLLLGLVFVVPWLAHASWHAYRDLVDAPPAARAGAARN
ncbi:MAG: DUF2189 domain-containing protein [Rubrivivax sp.]|nr:DUF2189 domain-containing protein [Rubrivivax sp.]